MGAVLASACLLAAAPAAAVTTVAATYIGPSPNFSTVSVTIIGLNDNNVRNYSAGRFLMDHGTLPDGLSLLGGNTSTSFMAFCIEPLQPLATSADYDLVPLSQATNSLGGIGQDKATLLRELFGRYVPGVMSVTDGMTRQRSAALQVAIWEIVTDGTTNIDLTNGNFRFAPLTTQNNQQLILTDARAMLSTLDGSGPLAGGLRAMRNGSPNTPGLGSQDVLVFTNLTEAVPEPQSWAMLIAGFGLVGAAARRRRRMQAAA